MIIILYGFIIISSSDTLKKKMYISELWKIGSLIDFVLKKFNNKYLSWDFLVLDALFPLTFELVLNLPGQVGLAFVAGLDAIAGNLELGLAVHALAGAGQPFAVFLKKINLKFQYYSLLSPLFKRVLKALLLLFAMKPRKLWKMWKKKIYSDIDYRTWSKLFF